MDTVNHLADHVLAGGSVVNKVTCGTCRLHASNFYGISENGFVSKERQNDCCADAELDLPASFNNQMQMDPDHLRYCAVWKRIHL